MQQRLKRLGAHHSCLKLSRSPLLCFSFFSLCLAATENCLRFRFNLADTNAVLRRFSAGVLWCKRPSTKPKDKFNLHEGTWLLVGPMIKGLFEQLATPTKLQPRGLEEVLTWTRRHLTVWTRATSHSNAGLI